MKKIKIIIFISAFILFILLGVIFWYELNINFKINSKSGYVKFQILPNQKMGIILDNLKKEKLISSTSAAYIYLNIQKPLFSFYPGEYRLYNGENLPALLNTFNKGPFYKIIYIPSGLRIAEEANVIRNELSVTNKQYKFSRSNFRLIAHKTFRNYYNYSFLSYIPSQGTLEGFLYPGYYTVPLNANAKYIIGKELSSFENNIFLKYKSLLIANTDNLSFYQNMVIASIVRRETLYNQGKSIVANIFIRRYFLGIPLGSDATVQYALGFDQSEGKWWRTNITLSDLNFKSPYNTRLYKGIPPTPICSPGINSILATFKSTPNNYLFFLAGKNGKLHFARTLAGQNANISKYL
jgi:UPF0755 protein